MKQPIPVDAIFDYLLDRDREFSIDIRGGIILKRLAYFVSFLAVRLLDSITIAEILMKCTDKEESEAKTIPPKKEHTTEDSIAEIKAVSDASDKEQIEIGTFQEDDAVIYTVLVDKDPDEPDLVFITDHQELGTELRLTKKESKKLILLLQGAIVRMVD